MLISGINMGIANFGVEAFMLIRLGKIRSELKNIFVINYKKTW